MGEGVWDGGVDGWRRRVLRRQRVGLVALAAFTAVLSFARPAPAGTVAEQRARLPPPAKCPDPVAGIWQSHDYDKRFSEWTIFTLEIRRDTEEKGKLVGKILNHSWLGGDTQSEPGPCEGRLRFKISMDAEGTSNGADIRFHGVGLWRMDAVVCGNWNAGYNLDHFTGTIDPELQEFQSVNNDGGRAVNDPTVFRRVKCFDEGEDEEEPSVTVAPPPFYPPEQTGGWGCLAS